MNSGMVSDPTLVASIHLGGNVSFTIMARIILVSLMHEAMKVNFVGYSISSRSYCVFNKITLHIYESINVVFDDTNDFR